MNEQSLFLRALEQPAGEPRRIWLEQECEDLGQRTRIAALLERNEKAGSFLENPPAELRGRNEPDSSAKAKPITKSKFVDRLIRSKLMTADEAAACDSDLESLQTAPDALSYAHAMVKANKLTGFQAKAICDGRIKGLTFGEYIILDRLGKGGMGIVYKAKHRRMDRLVAIKVLPRSAMATKGLEDRFYREVKTAAKLMHPNIVAALDASEDDGLHYLVMEYVDGQDLGEVLRQSGPLQPEDAVNYIIQAARGLQYAHEQGVIHRDIKPANLLIDGNGTVKVLDMGLARVTGVAGEGLDESSDPPSAKAAADGGRSSCDAPATLSWGHDTATFNDQTRLTKAGEVMGTLAYMSPEQFTDSHNVDERGDIYSLGCTLYRLLTGQTPFPADTVSAIFTSHRDDPIPSLRAVRPDIPEQLERAFQRMLAKEPERRQSSMFEVIEELEESLCVLQSPQAMPVGELQTASHNHALHTNTFSVASHPAGAPQVVLSRDRPIRRRRRNRLAWIPAALAACLLLLIGVLIFVQKTETSNSGLASSGEASVSADGDGGSNRPPNIVGQGPRATAPDEDSGKAATDNEDRPSSGGTANDSATETAPTERVEEAREHDDQHDDQHDDLADRSKPNGIGDRARKPMNWIGGTNWTGSFGVQGGPNFAPSAVRRIEFNDRGKSVLITEDGSGITVSVDGRVVKAANAAELSKKDARAFELYDKAFGVKDAESPAANSAWELQRMQWERLREMHSPNPQLKSLLDGILPVDKK